MDHLLAILITYRFLDNLKRVIRTNGPMTVHVGSSQRRQIVLHTSILSVHV